MGGERLNLAMVDELTMAPMSMPTDDDADATLLTVDVVVCVAKNTTVLIYIPTRVPLSFSIANGGSITQKIECLMNKFFEGQLLCRISIRYPLNGKYQIFHEKGRQIQISVFDLARSIL